MFKTWNRCVHWLFAKQCTTGARKSFFFFLLNVEYVDWNTFGYFLRQCHEAIFCWRTPASSNSNDEKKNWPNEWFNDSFDVPQKTKINEIFIGLLIGYKFKFQTNSNDVDDVASYFIILQPHCKMYYVNEETNAGMKRAKKKKQTKKAPCNYTCGEIISYSKRIHVELVLVNVFVVGIVYFIYCNIIVNWVT